MMMMKSFASVALLFMTVATVTVFASDATTSTPIVVALRQQNVDVLRERLEQNSDIDSPLYGKHLTAAQLASIIGATAEDRQAAEAWLLLNGASNVRLMSTGDYMTADVPSRREASRLIAAAAASSSSSSNGIASPPGIEFVMFADPASLELHSQLETVQHRIRERASQQQQQGHRDAVQRGSGFSKLESLLKASNTKLTIADPNTQRKAYGIPASTRGTSAKNLQLVWGPGTYGFLDSDLATFYSDFSVNETTKLLHHSGFPGVPGGDNFGECTLDVTYISSIGQGVNTVASNTNKSMSTEEGDGFGAALVHFSASLAATKQESLPTVLSMSLGSLTFASCHMLCEQAAPVAGITFDKCWAYMQQQRQVCMFTGTDQLTRSSVEFMKLGARGVTAFAASGDGGSHFSFQKFPSDPIGSALNQIGCAVNFPTYPASDPYVTGVGGTQYNGNPAQPVPWGASGGGFSWTFPQPTYQAAAVTSYLKHTQAPPATAFNASNRAYPDLAAVAWDVPMVMQGQLTLSGGTSAAAPAAAGIFSLLNDARLRKGLPSLGFINPRLYKVAAEFPGEAFYQMASGNSACTSGGSCCPQSTSFQAAADWDPITGLGSPLFEGLLKHLGSD